MSESDLPAGTRRADLSALMDGELDAHVAAGLCARWRSDERQREDWHDWHLIGDVLRSEELASAPARDEVFLARLRTRLAAEPVVIAPATAMPAATLDQAAELPQIRPAAPARAPRSALRRWAAPMGMAAGVVMVAGAVLVTRPDPNQALVGLMSAAQPLAAADGASASAPMVMERNPVNDAQLARYLSAHKEYPGAAVLVPAPGYLRNAAYETSPR